MKTEREITGVEAREVYNKRGKKVPAMCVFYLNPRTGERLWKTFEGTDEIGAVLAIMKHFKQLDRRNERKRRKDG